MSESTSSQPKTKKARISSSSSSSSKPESILKVTSLQSQLSNSTDLNPLNDLIQFSIQLTSQTYSESHSQSSSSFESDCKALHKAINVLSRALITLTQSDKIPLNTSDNEGLATGGNKIKKGENEGMVKVRVWLRNRWNESVLLLCALLAHQREEIKSTALRHLFSLEQASSASFSRTQSLPLSASNSSQDFNAQVSAQWSATPFKALVLTLLAGPPTLDSISINDDDMIRNEIKRSTEKDLISKEIKQMFADDFMEKYDDVRFMLCREFSSILKSPPTSARSAPLRSEALSILILLTAIPTKKSDLNAFWVPELGVTPIIESAKKSNKKKGGKKSKKFSEDGDSDEEASGSEDEEEGMDGWFSDSDEESEGLVRKNSNGQDLQSLKNKNEKKLEKESRNRRRRNPPIHQALHLIGAQKAAFSNAWLDLLLPKKFNDEVEDEKKTKSKKVQKQKKSSESNQIIGGNLNLAETHEILLRLHAQVLPHLTKPNQLHDFLVDCLSFGGPTSLLALNAIFTLIVTHNLDFPSFYNKLYSLLDSTVLHVRYRSRFLRLLETFLSSTHLPSNLIASFLKKLSRLSLRSSPSAIVSLIPFVYNLLKKHPSCMKMIHKTFEGDRLFSGPMGVEDGFKDDEKDPMKTNALEESSLWELAAFGASRNAMLNMGLENDAIPGGESHYLSQVSTLNRILAEPFTRERYDLEDFLDITYGTLFENETFKTLQRREEGSKGKGPLVPALNHSLPVSKDGAPFQAFPTGSSVTEASKADPSSKRKRDDDEKKTEVVDDDDDEDEDREEKEAMKDLERLQKEGSSSGYGNVKIDVQDPCARLFGF